MSKELKITTERIKKLAEGLDNCRDAQQAVKDAFPEAFEEKEKKWEDITSEVEWRLSDCGKKQYWLKGYYEGDEVVYWYASEGIHECTRPGFKLVINSNVFGVFKKT